MTSYLELWCKRDELATLWSFFYNFKDAQPQRGRHSSKGNVRSKRSSALPYSRASGCEVKGEVCRSNLNQLKISAAVGPTLGGTLNSLTHFCNDIHRPLLELPIAVRFNPLDALNIPRSHSRNVFCEWSVHRKRTHSPTQPYHP